MAAASQMMPEDTPPPVSNQQRVKYANFSVTKDGVFERPDPSWSSQRLDDSRRQQPEPWNVEGITISSKGIEVLQYAQFYDRTDMTVGKRELKQDVIAWSVLFGQGSMKDIRFREMRKPATTKATSLSIFIEICFKYEGVPESKDATQLKTVGPEEAEGTEMEEGKMKGEGQEGKGQESEGEKGPREEAEKGKAAEGEAQEEKTEEEGVGDVEVEDGEEVGVKIGDEPLAADELNLAKLFAGPNEHNDLEVRIAFLRSSSTRKPFQWQWPAVFEFLRGRKVWRPQCNIPQTNHRVSLPLGDYIWRFASHHGQFAAQRQKDKTTRWLMNLKLDRPQQQPSTAGLAVPAFGAPLPKAAQPKSTLTPTPTPEFSQGSRKRTREEIDAKDDELDQDVKRVMAEMNEKMQEILARRKRLRDERKQLYH